MDGPCAAKRVARGPQPARCARCVRAIRRAARAVPESHSAATAGGRCPRARRALPPRSRPLLHLSRGGLPIHELRAGSQNMPLQPVIYVCFVVTYILITGIIVLYQYLLKYSIAFSAFFSGSKSLLRVPSKVYNRNNCHDGQRGGEARV